MKKLISAVLVLASMAVSSTALAATSDGTLGSQSRNDVSSFQTVVTGTDSMPGFRSGDVISFDVTNLTSGNNLTVISYKCGDSVALGNDTIQYVNQYQVDESSKTIEYTVRENTEEGIYKVTLNGNDGSEVITFYYKVGNPSVSMMVNDSTPYWNITEYENGGVKKFAVGFIAKAVIGSADVSLADVGIKELGFNFTANGETVTQKLTKTQFDAIKEATKYAETEGGVSFVYGVTIYGMTSMEQVNAITADTYVLEN